MKITTHHFTVVGEGPFPIDMLRYDRATPTHEQDSQSITWTFSTHNVSRRIELQGPKLPTEGRWASFGWPIVSHEAVTTTR